MLRILGMKIILKMREMSIDFCMLLMLQDRISYSLVSESIEDMD